MRSRSIAPEGGSVKPVSRLTSACLVALLAATQLAGQVRPAEAGWREQFEGILSVTDYWTGEAAIRSEQAVVLGGIALYRYRHTLSGSVIGCAAGAALGA